MPTAKTSGPKGPAPKVAAATSGDVAASLERANARLQALADMALSLEQKNAELQALLEPIVRRWSAPNGRARKRLISLLETAKSDPEIAASPPTQEIVELLLDILSDSSPDDAMAPFLILDPMLPTAESVKRGRAKGAATANVARAKLPEASDLQRELASRMSASGCTLVGAKEWAQRKYGVTRAAVNARLRKLKAQ